MATKPLSRKHSLFLLFKDNLSESGGLGFPLVSKSPAILRHLAVNDPDILKRNGIEEKEIEIVPEAQKLLFEEPNVKDPFWQMTLPSGYCVWGWWRKVWECHPELFTMLKERCKKNETVNILLYNQYLRQIYRAKLKDIFFLPYLTSVTLPTVWHSNCPPYYRDSPRLCGAFLLMKIDENPLEDTSTLLNSMFVDSASFELNPLGLKPVIQPDSSVREICAHMIDKPIDRTSVRKSDHTILLLREYRQIDTAEKMLTQRTRVPDRTIAATFGETDWSDTWKLLNGMPPQGWIALSRSPVTLSVIGEKARQFSSRITRFDLELTAWLFSLSSMKDLFVVSPGEFTPLGKAVRTWTTAPSPSEARQAASRVFQSAWEAISESYGLESLSEYFERLSPLETVASAVHHDIDKKFYRDHLSHNVRAALLGTRLVETALIQTPQNVNPQKIAFFSGLLHDIAFPISTYPEMAGKMASVLRSVQGGTPSSCNPSSLLSTDFLQLSLHYVALLASVPLLLFQFPNGCNPWDKPSEAISAADVRLLDELLLSARAEDHAIISSAIIFYRAVLKRCGGNLQNIDSGVRTLMLHMTGPGATPEAKELLGLLQCVALHDRKASLKFHPIATAPRDAPTPLRWEKYGLPIVVAIADEFQEWGRPIGALEGMSIVDSTINFLDNINIKVKYDLNTDPQIFANLPYSLLFLLFGKLRVCSGFRKEIGGAEQPFKLSCELNNLKTFHLKYIHYRDFVLEFDHDTISINMATWPSENTPINNYRGINDQHLLSIRDGEEPGHDFIIIEGNAAACTEIINEARAGNALSSIKLIGNQIEIECNSGRRFNGRVIECHYGKIIKQKSAPGTSFPADGSSSLFRLQFENTIPPAVRTEATPPHLLPHPHFLDFDWRFTETSSKWIVEAARKYATKGKICYLGCPSLAIWHNILHPGEAEWRLLDRGHFALQEWLGRIIPEVSWLEYDVFNQLPPNLLNKFEVVVTDPPWYKIEFEAFCRRVGQLVENNALVFISSYSPFPPYKAEKYLDFSSTIKRELSDPTLLGSLEIDYVIPEFESTWQGHKGFLHPGLHIYRPGYLDIYRIKNPISTKSPLQRLSRFLSEHAAMEGRHHIRYRDDIIWPYNVNVSRYASVKHLKRMPEDIIAWTSKNAIARREQNGNPVDSLASLISLIERWELDNTP